MSMVQLRPAGHFSLIGRFNALQLVPPGACTKKVGTDFRGSDWAHSTSILTCLFEFFSLFPSEIPPFSTDGAVRV